MHAIQAAALIKVPEEITGDWLQGVLGVEHLVLGSVERIGTGQMSQSYRARFNSAAGAASVVVKLASDDETSRATGVGMGAYYREVAFYRRLADRLEGPLPRCHLAEYDDSEGWFTLVLEDVGDAVQGDQIAGCTVEQAQHAMKALAELHAPVLNDLAVGTQDWLNLPNPLTQELLTSLLPGFLERHAERISPEHAEVCRRFVASADAWFADRRAPLGLVHGDYRLDNLLFTEHGCAVVDWQTVTWGPVVRDAAYFLGGGLRVEDRRAHECELLALYHAELVALGVQNFSFEECWEEYRRQVFLGLVMVIVPAMVVVRTERGDEMFMSLLERVCEQILDLDAQALLPGAGEKPAALQPATADEGLHESGPEPLWNESFYFDAVDDGGELGVYVRLGRLPNRGECVYTAAIVRPGEPALMIVDLAPLPVTDDTQQVVHTERVHGVHECVSALETYRVTLNATAQSHEDHSAPLRGETGSPVPVTLDLTWNTAGTPYAWRASTRYEIPCRVTGSVTIDGTEHRFSGPGQRDHSYGSRDWWATDWMWSAFHFEDGTHSHAVTMPDLPGFSVGYVQREGKVFEIESGSSEAVLEGNGLISSAKISSGPDLAELTVEPLAFGALRMVAPDGRRVAWFPRAMARVRTANGQTGLGWIEWNRLQAEGS